MLLTPLGALPMNRLSSLGFLAAFGAAALTFAQEVTPATPPKDLRLSRDTPEGTLRIFTLGIMIGNEELIKATAVPESEDDMKLLSQKPEGPRPSDKELKEICANMKVRS